MLLRVSTVCATPAEVIRDRDWTTSVLFDEVVEKPVTLWVMVRAGGTQINFVLDCLLSESLPGPSSQTLVRADVLCVNRDSFDFCASGAHRHHPATPGAPMAPSRAASSVGRSTSAPE